MALTLAELQAQRDDIVEEMGKPISVHYDNRGVTRRPQAELEAALARIDSEISRLQNSQARQFTIQTSRGL